MQHNKGGGQNKMCGKEYTVVWSMNMFFFIFEYVGIT